MFFWFIGTAVLAVWYVFRDGAFDYRLLLVGAVLADVVDGALGGARVLHSVTASVVLLAMVMMSTSRRKPLRRLLLPLPIGTFLHLVFDGAWSNSVVFWWPFLGSSFEDAPLPTVARGWWSVALEVIGIGVVVWIWRSCQLGTRAARQRFLHTGVLQWRTHVSRPPARSLWSQRKS
jgi:hypothetical protein